LKLIFSSHFSAFFEIAFPIAIVLIFSSARQAFEPQTYPEIKYRAFNPFSSRCQFGNIFFGIEDIQKIYFSPNDAFHEKLMKDAIGQKSFTLIGVADENELNVRIRNQSVIEPVAAVQFSIDSSVSLKIFFRDTERK
jgi:hypothetical protein